MQKHLHINKNLVLILASLVLFFGSSYYFVAPTVFGGGAGMGGGTTGAQGYGTGKCTGCNSPWNSSMGSQAGGSWKDANGSGKLDSGDTVRGSNGGGGGNGGNGGGGGGGGQPQSRACVITLSAPVVASGTPSMALSWTPTPNGKVSLSRAGSKGKTMKIPVPDNANTYTDTILTLTPGTYTYSVSFAKAAGKVKGASTENVNESISTMDGSAQLALGVTSSGAATPGGAAGGYSGGTGNWGSGGFGGSSGGGGFSGGGGGSNSGGGSSSGGSTGFSGYSCTASFKVVATLTQCNDGVDNSDTEDTLLDQQDPGCHTDGNPGNTKTYDPTDTSELNPNSDLVPTLSTVTKVKAKRPVRVTSGAKNTSAYYAVSNSLVYGWRDTSVKAKAPKCGRNGRNCFTENGHTFLRMKTFTKAYRPGQARKDRTRSFRPLVSGQYEVCAIADVTNKVVEGPAGEANNRTCAIVIADDDTPVTPGDDSDIDGPLTISASPSVMRRGQTSTVSWDTGGRVQCSITNSTTQAINFMDDDGDPRITDEEETPPITAQTTYTISCTDPGFEATETATIRILPEFREI